MGGEWMGGSEGGGRDELMGGDGGGTDWGRD